MRKHHFHPSVSSHLTLFSAVGDNREQRGSSLSSQMPFSRCCFQQCTFSQLAGSSTGTHLAVRHPPCCWAPTLLLGTHLPSRPAASRCVLSTGSCGGDQSGLPLRTACQSVAPSFPDEHPPPAGSDEALPPALRRGSALARPGARVPPRLRARVAWCLLPRYRRAQRRASRWCCAEENCLDLEQTGCFEQHKGSQSEKRR